jgi:hypothetical protein
MIYYKAISTDGQEDYYAADNAELALGMAIVMFGPGVAVRPAYYGEWDCGLRCGYDLNVRHYYVNSKGEREYSKTSLSENEKFGSTLN